ncbi:protein kinase [Candidatus Sumerlaeota bacterium]|nr:protein kinase [Candidatus Sumerlaeota bacterium]
MPSPSSGVLARIRSRWGAKSRLRLGEFLVREGLIGREQLAVALEHQLRKGFRIGYHLVKLGMIEEEVLGAFLAEQVGVPAVGDQSFHIEPDLFDKIPHSLLEHGQIFPLHRAGNTLTLVMCDPTDDDTISQVERLMGLRVNPVVGPQSVIQRQLARFFALEEIREKMGTSDESVDLARFFAALKDYRFQSILGVGGFGVVCKCWQVSLDRPVAIKTMSRQLSSMEGMIERFRREGRIIAHLNHPNIIQVFEQGELCGLCYIVMEHFEGEPLDAFCRVKDVADQITCVIPICDALDFAFTKGVTHRDIKPSNILANDAGDVKLLDFGIAYRDDPQEPRLTRQHIVLGTPKYMAPECFHGAEETSVLTDIYAMGVVIYELLTGKEPTKPNPDPPQKINPLIPGVLGEALVQALEPDPTRRLASFELLKRALILARDQILMGHTTAIQSCARIEDAASPAPAVRAPKPRDMDKFYTEERVLRDDESARVSVARHLKMNRRVVIRRVKDKSDRSDAPARLSETKHPHLGQVLGCGSDGQDQVVVMEYIDGGRLADRMQAGAIPREDCIAQWLDMVQALRAAWERGIAHGRLHPGNILFTSKGQLKVVDFLGRAGRRGAQFARFGRPEITDPWELDHYALGVIWFEMLTGERFRGASSYAQNFQKVQHSSKIDPLLKIPLGRLWGIARYGPKYENYAEMIDDLQIVREKIDPAISVAIERAQRAHPRAPRSAPSVLLQTLYVVLGIAVLLGIGFLSYIVSSK